MSNALRMCLARAKLDVRNKGRLACELAGVYGLSICRDGLHRDPWFCAQYALCVLDGSDNLKRQFPKLEGELKTYASLHQDSAIALASRAARSFA